MVFQDGIWQYKGKAFASLHEALVSVWRKLPPEE